MYMPGRLRTASRPSRTVMSFAPYSWVSGSGVGFSGAATSLFSVRHEGVPRPVGPGPASPRALVPGGSSVVGPLLKTAFNGRLRGKPLVWNPDYHRSMARRTYAHTAFVQVS